VADEIIKLESGEEITIPAEVSAATDQLLKDTKEDILSAIHSRQEGIIPGDKVVQHPVTIVGLGHVGSFVALMLTKAGAFTHNNTLCLIDFDKYDFSNLGMQFCTFEDAGKYKPEALGKRLLEFGAVDNARLITGKFDPTMAVNGSITDGIVIASVDKMDVRKQILDACIANPRCVKFIDTRTGAELVEIYNINPQSRAEVDWYMSTWAPDEEMDDDPCAMRGASYTTMGITSLVGMCCAALWRGNKFPNKISWDMANRMMDEEYHNQEIDKEVKKEYGAATVEAPPPVKKFSITAFKQKRV
jgi:molybdopterin/thiamine biosynthesis adenylyltransferase